MEKPIYDLIIVGGGIGGSVLAKVMAEKGARVLVVERDKQFKDRVRGEGMHAWGVPEAKALGVYKLLRDTCGLEVRWWDIYLGTQMFAHRDFTETTPHRSPLFSFYHPDMQEVLLTAAAAAGAEVWRGAAVRRVRSEPLPTVTVEQDGWMHELRARLVVGADGRTSPTRKWMGFEVQEDPCAQVIHRGAARERAATRGHLVRGDESRQWSRSISRQYRPGPSARLSGLSHRCAVEILEGTRYSAPLRDLHPHRR